MQKAWVWSLGQENSLELEMATHSSILAQKIPRAEEPGGLQSMGLQRVGHGGEPEHIHMSISVHCSASHLHSVFTSYIARSGHHCTKKKEWLPSSRPSPMPDICHLLCWLFLCKCTKCVMFMQVFGDLVLQGTSLWESLNRPFCPPPGISSF